MSWCREAGGNMLLLDTTNVLYSRDCAKVPSVYDAVTGVIAKVETCHYIMSGVCRQATTTSVSMLCVRYALL